MDVMESQTDKYYAGQRLEMLKYIPENTDTVLDVGCGYGNFGHMIKAEFGYEVWGVDINKESITNAQKLIDKAICADISSSLDLLPESKFDVIFFNDVLEHLEDPYSLLVRIKSKLKSGGSIVCSIPNVRFFKNLKHLLRDKDWHYVNAGILDKTHLRFFTKKSIFRMFDELGFEIIVCEGINPYKSARPYIFHYLTFGFLGLDTLYEQFAVVAKPANTESSLN